ncbi:MMPL domain-containing protein, partial [mine drainage metagenome]
MVLVISVPAVTGLSSVFKGSLSSSLPSSDTSVIAQNKLTEEFPNASGAPSSSLLLLTGNDTLGPAGQNATQAIVHSIQADPRVRYLSSVTSLYSAYVGYLRLQASAGLGVLHGALTNTPALPSALNLTIHQLWGPLATYVHNWTQVASGLPSGASPTEANWPAYLLAQDYYNSSPPEQTVLSAFYYGNGSTAPGFNETVSSACLSSRNITPCADLSAHATLPTVVGSLFPPGTSQTLALLAAQNLDLENATKWGAVQTVAATYLGIQAGQPASWLVTLWNRFPSGLASPSELTSWATGLTETLPVSRFPLPIPHSLRSSFVSPDGSTTLLVISFTEPDNYTVAGQTPIFQDIQQINSDASSALASSPQYQGFAFYQTGSAPLDEATTTAATSTLGFLLALTVILLIVIMIGYFRAPAAPLVTFTGIGVSIFVTLAALLLVATYVTTISSFLESVLLVFLMAIVTDYSIFMMARYREELVQGRTSQEAVVASVRWAGQSITTSGLTVFSVAIAMVFSGLSFLNELGIALAIAVVVAILMALTVIPAVLVLAGPRVFWPYTGERFVRQAQRRRESIRAGRTYFSRAGRLATSRPYAVILIILLLSVPVIYVALNVPVSYDLTNVGLPSDNPAQKGLTLLEDQFGQSSVSSSFVLVTFAHPIELNGTVNA